MGDLLKVRMVGPSGADVAGALVQLSGPETARLAYKVVRIGVARIKARAGVKLRSGGIGRRIWGRDTLSKGKGSNLGAFIKVKTVKRGNEGFAIAFSEKGLPAMVEEGGRTAAHTIAPKFAEALVYRTKSGALHVSTKPVLHPGGPVHKDPHLGPAIDAEAPRISADLTKAQDGLVERATSKRLKGAA